jgi:hypothetical protein
MSFKCPDFVKEYIATSGTGDLLFGGALDKWRVASSQLVDGDVFPYMVDDRLGNWEAGYGTYHSGANSFSRTVVSASSNAGALVSFSTATKVLVIGPIGSLATPALIPPPELELNFLAMGGNLDPKLTFTRASAALYVNSSGILTSATTNAPRFDYDPVSLTLRGLLLETATTNICLQSNSFSTTPWVVGSSAAISSAAVSVPDGTTNGWLLSDSTVAGTQTYVQCTVSGGVTGSTVYTFSIYAKYRDFQWVQLNMNGTPGGSSSGCFFDLINGATGTATGGSGSIVPAGNGWFRCSFTYTTVASDTGCVSRVWVAGSGGSTNHTGVIGNGVYLYGGQFEAGSVPTSYIATTTVSVTRAADMMSMPTSLFPFNPMASTALLEYSLPYDSAGNLNLPFAFGGAANADRAFLRRFTTTAHAAVMNSLVPSTVFNVIFGVSDAAFPGPAKVGMSWDSAKLLGSAVQNGSANYAALSGLVGNDISVLKFYASSGSFQPNGWVRRLRYWNFKIPNAALQFLSSPGAP